MCCSSAPLAASMRTTVPSALEARPQISRLSLENASLRRQGETACAEQLGQPTSAGKRWGSVQ